MKSQKRNRKFSQRLVAAANKKAKTPGKKREAPPRVSMSRYEAFWFSTAFINLLSELILFMSKILVFICTAETNFAVQRLINEILILP